MPVYEYHALDSQGKKRKGIVEADGLAQARSRLRASGLYPVSFKESRARKSGGESWLSFSLFNNVSAEETFVVTRQLGGKIELDAQHRPDEPLLRIPEKTEKLGRGNRLRNNTCLTAPPGLLPMGGSGELPSGGTGLGVIAEQAWLTASEIALAERVERMPADQLARAKTVAAVQDLGQFGHHH